MSDLELPDANESLGRSTSLASQDSIETDGSVSLSNSDVDDNVNNTYILGTLPWI